MGRAVVVELLTGDRRGPFPKRSVDHLEGPAQPDLPLGRQTPEQGLIGHADGPSFDDDIEPGAKPVPAGGQNTLRVGGQVPRLLLLGSRAEVQGAVEPDRGQRRHVRTPVATHGRQPEHLRLVQHADDLRPWERGGLLAAESLVELRDRFRFHRPSPVVLRRRRERRCEDVGLIGAGAAVHARVDHRSRSRQKFRSRGR